MSSDYMNMYFQMMMAQAAATAGSGSSTTSSSPPPTTTPSSSLSTTMSGDTYQFNTSLNMAASVPSYPTMPHFQFISTNQSIPNVTLNSGYTAPH